MIKSIKRAVIKAKICYYELALSIVRKIAAILESCKIEYFAYMTQKEYKLISCKLADLNLDKLDLARRIEALNLELGAL